MALYCLRSSNVGWLWGQNFVIVKGFGVLLIHKSSLFSSGRGFPGSKQLAVLLRIENGGCFGDLAEGAEGA